MTSTTVLDAIEAVFRDEGFEGASMARLSEATGLARASLYHRFPGGKVEMAAAATRAFAERFDACVAEALEGGPPAGDALDRLRTGLETLYRDGQIPCLFESLTRGAGAEDVVKVAVTSLGRLERGLEQLLESEGCSPDDARGRARGFMRSLAGGIALVRITRRPEPFREAMDALTRLLDDE